MKRMTTTALLICLAAAPAVAQRLAYSGLDPSAHISEGEATDYARNLGQWAGGSVDPHIAYVDSSEEGGGVLQLLTDAGFTDLTPILITDLDTANLAGFDLLWIGRVIGDSAAAEVALAEANVQSYVDGCGNIVAEDQRDVDPNAYDWLPYGDGLGAVTSDTDVVLIADPTHPTMTGLTAAGLSGWGNSIHKYFTAPGSGGFDTILTDDESNSALIVREQSCSSILAIPTLSASGASVLALFLAGAGIYVVTRRRVS